MSKEKKLQIRNSTAEFLIFTGQSGEQSIEARSGEAVVRKFRIAGAIVAKSATVQGEVAKP